MRLAIGWAPKRRKINLLPKMSELLNQTIKSTLEVHDSVDAPVQLP